MGRALTTTPPPRRRLRLIKDVGQCKDTVATPEKVARPNRPCSAPEKICQTKPIQEPKSGFQPGPTKEEIRRDLCMARVWGNGFGGQCVRKPLGNGFEFCGFHKGRLAHGRVDGAVPPEKLKQMQEAVLKSSKAANGKGHEAPLERQPNTVAPAAPTRGYVPAAAPAAAEAEQHFSWLSDGEEEPSARPFPRTTGKRSRRRHRRAEYLSGHAVSFVVEVGDVVRACSGTGAPLLGEICELAEDGSRKLVVLRRMYEAAELRKRCGLRAVVHDKEVVASEQFVELSLSSLLRVKPFLVLSKKAYASQQESEDVSVQDAGCMFCYRTLTEGDVLWELDWDSQREKQREECLRVFRGLPKKEAPRKVSGGVQELFHMAIAALRPFACEGNLPGREVQQASVIDFLKGSLQSKGSKEVLYISGMPGTGKTASVQDAVKRLQRTRTAMPIKYAYVNAMCLSTPSAVFAEIQRKVVGHSQKKRKAGDGEEALRQTLTQAGDEVIILVIDELDALVTQGQTVLYRLFEWMSQPTARLVVVAIANTMDLPERLLPRVSSRLGIKHVHFEAYTRDQLHKILADRLCFGKATDTIKHDALKLCAARVAAGEGDARKALQVCQRALQRAIDASVASGEPPEVVTIAQMDKAEAELLRQNPVAVGIMNLNLKPRCFLLGLVLELRSQNTHVLSLKTISRRYEGIMRILQQRKEGAGKAAREISSERCAQECDDLQQRLQDLSVLSQYAMETGDDIEMGLGFGASIDVSEAANALSVGGELHEIAKELLDLQSPPEVPRLG